MGSDQFFPLVFGLVPEEGLICETRQVLRDDHFFFCIIKTIPSGGWWHRRCIVGFCQCVNIIGFGSCCPSKESEARTPCKTAGSDFATDSATNFQRYECVSLPTALHMDQVRRRQSVGLKTQKAVIDPYLHSCSSLPISASTNDKTNAIETTYIFRGFTSHIHHLNCSEWRNNTPNEQRKQKNVVGRNAPRNEEEQCIHA